MTVGFNLASKRSLISIGFGDRKYFRNPTTLKTVLSMQSIAAICTVLLYITCCCGNETFEANY